MARDILFIAVVKRSEKLEIPIASCVWHDNRLTWDGGMYENSIHGKWEGMFARIGLLLQPLQPLVNGVYVSAGCTCELRKYIRYICYTCDIGSTASPLPYHGLARFSYRSVLFSISTRSFRRVEFLHVDSWQAISGSSLPLSVFYHYLACWRMIEK